MPRLRPTAATVLLVACTGDAPVLQGVPDDRILTAPPAEVAQEESAVARRSANPKLYVKPDELYLDAAWITGRGYQEARAVVSQQAGALIRSQPLSDGRGDELVFERATLRVLEDRIYRVELPLPEPTRRDLALSMLGFAPAVGEWLSTHREYRLNNERGYRRIRMQRMDADTELVTQVEAWKFIPGEHGNRR